MLFKMQKYGNRKNPQLSHSTCARILSRGSVQPITCKVFNELVNNELVPSPVSAF